MANGIQTTNGKAFEYACVLSLYMDLSGNQNIEINDSPQIRTAKRLFESLPNEVKCKMMVAALAAEKIIKNLEPRLTNSNDDEPLYLSLQPDSAGIAGDVRDVVCIRKQNGWQIGLSCKHNHHAVKHSRLSATIDFGKEWLGVPCSEEYFSKVVPIFSELKELKDSSKVSGTPILWEQIEDKTKKYYMPILEAFIMELRRIDSENRGLIPERLIRYLLGEYDFYKVIADDKDRFTRVEAINISGTLNASSINNKAISKVPKLKMPTQFYHIGFKEGSNNTIEVVCDGGWQISMRIHNASSKVEPSLKFDVQLISFPSDCFVQIGTWGMDEDLLKRLIKYIH